MCISNLIAGALMIPVSMVPLHSTMVAINFPCHSSSLACQYCGSTDKLPQLRVFHIYLPQSIVFSLCGTIRHCQPVNCIYSVMIFEQCSQLQDIHPSWCLFSVPLGNSWEALTFCSHDYNLLYSIDLFDVQAQFKSLCWCSLTFKRLQVQLFQSSV